MLTCTYLLALNGWVRTRFVFHAEDAAKQFGLLKTGEMDPYCLKPNPRTLTFYRLTASAPELIASHAAFAISTLVLTLASSFCLAFLAEATPM